MPESSATSAPESWEPNADPGHTTFLAIGWGLVVIGVLLIGFALLMETTVESTVLSSLQSQRVSNIGLIGTRTSILGVGQTAILSGVGLVIYDVLIRLLHVLRREPRARTTKAVRRA